MKTSLIKWLFFRSWWMIAFMLICAIAYERGVEKKERQFKHLSEQLSMLEAEKQQALAKQEDLQCQINSQSDLSWIELTLMRVLGVCPEDYQKVYFIPNPSSSNLSTSVQR